MTETADRERSRHAAATAAAPRERIALMDCPIDSVTFDEALDRCLASCTQSQRPHLVIPINVGILMAMRRNEPLRDACLAGDLLLADGMPVVWAARLLGGRLPHRVSGVDLMARLLEAGGPRGLRVFLLGAEEGVSPGWSGSSPIVSPASSWPDTATAISPPKTSPR